VHLCMYLAIPWRASAPPWTVDLRTLNLLQIHADTHRHTQTHTHSHTQMNTQKHTDQHTNTHTGISVCTSVIACMSVDVRACMFVCNTYVNTGWRRPTGCLKLQGIFRKTATNCRALLRKMTYEHKASYDPTPPSM